MTINESFGQKYYYLWGFSEVIRIKEWSNDKISPLLVGFTDISETQIAYEINDNYLIET